MAAGIIPNVIQRDGNDVAEVEFEYVETAVTNEMLNSKKPEDLERCLKAGKIPTAYSGFLDIPQISVRKSYECTAPSNIKEMSDEELKQLALQGYFVRDAARNLVYCPQGSILRQKSLRKDGHIRYCNKQACRKCSHKCTKSVFKEADFNKDTLVTKAQNYKGDSRNHQDDQQIPKTRMKREVKVHKVVTYKLHLDKKKMAQRKCLSEHPFGTMKRTLGAYYFLLKTKVKVEAEMALICLSYNMRRAISMLGVPQLIAKMA